MINLKFLGRLARPNAINFYRAPRKIGSWHLGGLSLAFVAMACLIVAALDLVAREGVEREGAALAVGIDRGNLADSFYANRGGEIGFISDDIEDFEKIAAAAGIDRKVIILVHTNGGLAQIARALKGRSPIDAIHLVTHGSAGRIVLGAEILDGSSIESFGGSLEILRSALAPRGNLLIYGCSVAAGAEGLALVENLSRLLGPGVAANSKVTGTLARGGDTRLDGRFGHVETAPLGFSGNATALTSVARSDFFGRSRSGCFSGNATALTSVASIGNLGVNFANTSFTGASATAVTGYMRADFGITFADPAVSASPTITMTPGTSTDNVTSQGPLAADVNQSGSSGMLTLSYESTGATSYGPSAPPPTLPGDYAVTVFVALSGIYNAASSSATAFTIGKPALPIKASNDTNTYRGTKTDGADSTAFTSSGLVNSETIGSVTITASGGTLAGDVVGTYMLTPSAVLGGTFNAAKYTISYAMNPSPRKSSFLKESVGLSRSKAFVAQYSTFY